MAAVGSSSMIGDNKIGAKAFVLTMWIGYFLISGSAAIPREELDDMIPVLRLRGCNCFGNAIKTSDLIKDCLAFAPTNESMEVAHISGESGLRSHTVPPRIGVSELIILPSPTIVTALLPNHTLSITVRSTRTTVHIAANGVSPGLYHSSHGLAGALIPLFHFPSCYCLPQSPIRATTPSLSAYAGPHALLRPQSASSNGHLLPPRPPETLDISIGFSISSTAAALTAAAVASGVIIHLFRPYLGPHDDDMDDDMDDESPQHFAPLDDDMDDESPQHFAPLDDDMDGLVLILQMILLTLRHQGIHLVRLNHEEEVLLVSPEQLGLRLRRWYTGRHEILTQPQYAMFRTPDDVILVIDLPDGTSLHLGQVPHYFINSQIYDNSFIVNMTPVDNEDDGPELDNDTDDPPRDLNEDGLVLIIQMILNTLRRQAISVVHVDHETFYPVNAQRLGVRLRRYYISLLEILTHPFYAMHRTPDNVILVIEMPDWTTIHLGQIPHYFINAPLYANSYVVRIFDADDDGRFVSLPLSP